MMNISKEDLIIQMLQNQVEMLKQVQHQGERNEQRIDRLEASINDRFEKLENSVNVRFEKVDAHFERLEASMNDRFEKVESDIKDLSHDVDRQFDEVNQTLAEFKNRRITWNAGIVSGIIAINAIINFIITRFMLSGPRLADLWKLDFWV